MQSLKRYLLVQRGLQNTRSSCELGLASLFNRSFNSTNVCSSWSWVSTQVSATSPSACTWMLRRIFSQTRCPHSQNSFKHLLNSTLNEYLANLMHLLNCTSHIHKMLQETWWCHHSKPVTHEVMRLACMKKHLVLLQRK